ncbi:hypothetical protein G436_0656 [Leptospira interrogans serovar Hardjo str. Norma]|uniref:Uncharacterized protein n=1 Tax=Leptospira interrogans serovar Hardjo str. Norma TaxID=1279460 RepID=A0A0M3TKS6_LEPIR|nr:hypothetical protein G436_0656 [Leptospira interrogans serovar Hardjo str. Norma]
MKNSIEMINKTVSSDRFIKQKQDGESIFQKFYSSQEKK